MILQGSKRTLGWTAALLWVLLLASELPQDVSSAEVDLGSFLKCGHDLEGKVTVINKRTIKIAGFKVVAGPNTWFHAQLKTADGVNAKDGTFDALQNQAKACAKVGEEKAAVDVAEVTLLLPKDVTEYKAISVYCYKACASFGHVQITDGIAADDPTDAEKADADAATCAAPDDAKACGTGDKHGNMMFDKCDPKPATGGAVDLGSLSNCEPTGHKVAGQVTVVHKRLIKITGLTVTTGPSTWFHAQLKTADKISAASGTFETLQNHEAKCEKLGEAGTAVAPTGDVELALPQDITEYKSIGLFCYAGCNNFGHVNIDASKTYADVPAGFASPAACTEKVDTALVTACTAPKNSDFAKCDGGPDPPPGTDDPLTSATGGNGTENPDGAAGTAAGIGLIAGGVLVLAFLAN